MTARWRRGGAHAAAAAAVVASLLLAATPCFAASSHLLASFEFDFAQANNQFGWTIITAPPVPTAVQIPAGRNGSVTYSVTFQRQLLHTKLRVGGDCLPRQGLCGAAGTPIAAAAAWR
jgi:hypothetical protein